MALVKQYNKETQAKRRADRVIYSDFFKNFNIHPEKRDLARHVNEYAVNEALKNLFFTNKGERFFNSDLGADINKLLFEPANPITLDMLNSTIQDAIKAFEPRVSVETVKIDASVDENAVTVTIVYNLLALQRRVIFSTIIERIR